MSITSSIDIQRVINREFPGEVIRNARTTAGGSLLVELNDKETADRVKQAWRKTLFGGNEGAVGLQSNPPAGIIRNVIVDNDDDEELLSEEDIANEITSQYENAETDFFHKGDEFTGTIKIVFNSTNDLEKAKKNPIKIFDQRYRVEEYEFRPRVIICNYCQKFGHVHRVCRSKAKGNPVCGKCAGKNHETIECNVSPAEYKCSHCDGSHQTGNKECTIYKHKLEEIKSRGNFH